MAMSVISRMSRAAPVTAVALGVLTLAAGLANVPLDSLIHQSGPGGQSPTCSFTAAVMVPAAGVGTLLAARRPGSPLGWILLAIFLIQPAHVSVWLAGAGPPATVSGRPAVLNADRNPDPPG